jgi:hypothetical protein
MDRRRQRERRGGVGQIETAMVMLVEPDEACGCRTDVFWPDWNVPP